MKVMSDKTVKDAVEHFGGVWPDCDFITVYKGNFHKHNYFYEQPLGAFVGVHYDKGTEIIDKQQFEDCVKEQKMDKQKYKYVNAGIKSVGELYDRIDTDDNGCFVGDEQLCIIVDGCSISFESTLEPLSLGEIKQILRQVTTRQPLPWYEVEGVFPCLVRNGVGTVRLLDSASDCVHLDYVTPLSPTEAAKYGVE